MPGNYATRYGVASPRIAVGRISDYTGKEEGDGSGRKITQGASLMAISAFAKAGARLVERYDTSISELELKYANNKLISDDGPPPAPGRRRRPRLPQDLFGPDPRLGLLPDRGITELNYNIRSAGVDIGLGYTNADDGAGLLSGKLYVMNIAMDLRLVETRTQEVVDVISYQKQLIGREVGAGVFRILGQVAVDLSAGEGALEPTQLAVRAVIERSVVEIMANLYGAPGPGSCMTSDPFGSGLTTGVTGSYYPAYNNLDQNNARHSRTDRPLGCSQRSWPCWLNPGSLLARPSRRSSTTAPARRRLHHPGLDVEEATEGLDAAATAVGNIASVVGQRNDRAGRFDPGPAVLCRRHLQQYRRGDQRAALQRRDLGHRQQPDRRDLLQPGPVHRPADHRPRPRTSPPSATTA